MSAPTIILAITIWWTAYVLFRLYIRPTILFALKTKIAALRDSMDISAMKNRQYREDPAYPIVRKRADDVIESLHLLNVSNVFFIETDQLVAGEIKVQNETIQHSNGDLREHEKKLCMLVSAAFAINGPFLAIITASFLILFIWSAFVQHCLKRFYEKAWSIPEQSAAHRNHATC